MNTILRITDVLFQKYGYYVPLAEIDYENHLFYHEDFDEEIVPLCVIDHLVAPIQTESANYTDRNGDYYVIIQVETGQAEPYEGWIVNDEVRKDFLDDLTY